MGADRASHLKQVKAEKNTAVTVLFSALSVDQARCAGKEKANEHPQTHRLQYTVCRTGHAYPAKATNNAKGAQCWQTNNKTTQPSGAAVPEEADARQRRAFASSGFSLPKCEREVRCAR